MATLDELFPDGYPEGPDWDALKHIIGDADLSELAAIATPANPVITTRLTDLALQVRAGQEAAKARDGLMRLARETDPAYWTQDRLAHTVGISQPAVRKALTRKPAGIDPQSTDPEYLIGRILGIARLVEDRLDRRTRSGPMADKMFGGRQPITAHTVAQLRSLLDRDIATLSGRYRGTAKWLENVLAEIYSKLPPISATAIRPGTALIFGYDHQRTALLKFDDTE